MRSWMQFRRTILRPISERAIATLTRSLVQSIAPIYLATDRWLKALISTIDAYLLLSNPSRTLIQNLRAAMLNNDSTSIFTCGAEFDSLNAVETAKLLSAVIRPKISDESHSAFVAALKAVATLRNNVQHGELYGDGDELLASVKRLLAELYLLARDVTPDFLAKASELNGQTVSRLKAYKQDVDAAWQGEGVGRAGEAWNRELFDALGRSVSYSKSNSRLRWPVGQLVEAE